MDGSEARGNIPHTVGMWRFQGVPGSACCPPLEWTEGARARVGVDGQRGHLGALGWTGRGGTCARWGGRGVLIHSANVKCVSA
eukprot:114305-Chlamydomonas_euryale.AAC.2